MWWRFFYVFSKAKAADFKMAKVPKLNKNKQNTKSDYLFSNLIPNLPNVMRWPPHGGPFTSFQHAKAGGWWLFRTVGRSKFLCGRKVGILGLLKVKVLLLFLPKCLWPCITYAAASVSAFGPISFVRQ